MSQYLGKKDDGLANRAAGQLVAITVLISLAVMALVVLFHAPVLGFLFGKVAPDVMEGAVVYLLISGLSYPFLAAYNSGAAIFRSLGNSRVPMFVSILMNVLSVGGVAVAVFALHAGVVGVAWATFAARGVAAVVMLVLVSRRTMPVAVRLRNVFAWDGPMVGRCVGAGDYAQAIAYTKRLIKQTYWVTAAISVAEVALLPLLLTLYAVSPETSRLTFLLVVIHNTLAIVLWPVSFTLSNALRAAGDVRFTMVIAIVSMFGFRIAFAFLLGVVLGLGVVGVWLAMGLDWTFRSVVMLLRFRGDRWKTKAVV